jgi:hypothetical protein
MPQIFRTAKHRASEARDDASAMDLFDSDVEDISDRVIAPLPRRRRYASFTLSLDPLTELIHHSIVYSPASDSDDDIVCTGHTIPPTADSDGDAMMTAPAVTLKATAPGELLETAAPATSVKVEAVVPAMGVKVEAVVPAMGVKAKARRPTIAAAKVSRYFAAPGVLCELPLRQRINYTSSLLTLHGKNMGFSTTIRDFGFNRARVIISFLDADGPLPGDGLGPHVKPILTITPVIGETALPGQAIIHDEHSFRYQDSAEKFIVFARTLKGLRFRSEEDVLVALEMSHNKATFSFTLNNAP